MPHFLPGQNTALTEWLKKEDWIPLEPARGGAKTLYPEYRSALAAPAVTTRVEDPAYFTRPYPHDLGFQEAPRGRRMESDALFRQIAHLQACSVPPIRTLGRYGATVAGASRGPF